MQRMETTTATAEKNTTRMKLRHYQDIWHGSLPASASVVESYIIAMAGQVDVELIQSRVYAVCKWHRDNAFPDPGADVALRELLLGVVKVHRYDHQPVQDASILSFTALEEICQDLEHDCAAKHHDLSHRFLMAHRDLALCLLGFWAGLSGRQLRELTVATINFPDTGGLDIAAAGASRWPDQADFSLHHLQELNRLCPVQALKKWLCVAGISEGPIFRSVSRWGKVSDSQISQGGINFILRRISVSHLDNKHQISSRSLPRGFAVWARTNGWSDEQVLDYLGITTLRSVYSSLTHGSKQSLFKTMLPNPEDNKISYDVSEKTPRH